MMSFCVFLGILYSLSFDIFTLSSTKDDVVTKLTIIALNNNGNTVEERIFENILIIINHSLHH